VYEMTSRNSPYGRRTSSKYIRTRR